jgi:site-specific recombinase XerD
LHDLIPLSGALPGALTTAEIDSAMHYARREKSEATLEAYASDWRDFAAWCTARGATPLPAHVGIVAAYLSSLADSGRKASTIGRRAAAIGYRHKQAGFEAPTNLEAVKTVLRGIRREIGTAKQGKAPATADLIGQMVALCPDNMIGKRDRALLCLGFAGAFRRSELCALEVADLTEVPDGLRILIRRSKGDQEGVTTRFVQNCTLRRLSDRDCLSNSFWKRVLKGKSPDFGVWHQPMQKRPFPKIG